MKRRSFIQTLLTIPVVAVAAKFVPGVETLVAVKINDVVKPAL